MIRVRDTDQTGAPGLELRMPAIQPVGPGRSFGTGETKFCVRQTRCGRLRRAALYELPKRRGDGHDPGNFADDIAPHRRIRRSEWTGERLLDIDNISPALESGASLVGAPDANQQERRPESTGWADRRGRVRRTPPIGFRGHGRLLYYGPNSTERRHGGLF